MLMAIDCLGRCKKNKDVKHVYEVKKNLINDIYVILPNEIQEYIFEKLPFNYNICLNGNKIKFSKKVYQTKCKSYKSRYCLPGSVFINNSSYNNYHISFNSFEIDSVGQREKSLMEICKDDDADSSTTAHTVADTTEKSSFHLTRNKKSFHYNSFPFNERDKVIILKKPFENIKHTYCLENGMSYTDNLHCLNLSISNCYENISNRFSVTEEKKLNVKNKQSVYMTNPTARSRRLITRYCANKYIYKSKLFENHLTISDNAITRGHFYWELFNCAFEEFLNSDVYNRRYSENYVDDKTKEKYKNYYDVILTFRKIRNPIDDTEIVFKNVKNFKFTKNIRKTFDRGDKYSIRITFDEKYQNVDCNKFNLKHVPIYKHYILPENKDISIIGLLEKRNVVNENINDDYLEDSTGDESGSDNGDIGGGNNEERIINENMSNVLLENTIGFEINLTKNYKLISIDTSNDGDLRFYFKTCIYECDRDPLIYSYYTSLMYPNMIKKWFSFDSSGSLNIDMDIELKTKMFANLLFPK